MISKYEQIYCLAVFHLQQDMDKFLSQTNLTAHRRDFLNLTYFNSNCNQTGFMKKVSRKDFLKAGGMAGAALLLSNCTGAETGAGISGEAGFTGKKYRWNMVTTWPPNFPVLGEGCNMFAKWVEEMSAGQLKIKVYGGGELVPALEVFDAVSSGTAEVGSGASYYWAGKTAAAQFFAAYPFGLSAQQMNAWLYCGGGLELWKEVYEPFNMIPMPGGNTGVQMGGWFNREINTPDDLKGLKMRIPGLGGKVLKEAGGAVVLSPGSEIYTNLERGVIDACEWIGPYHDYKMGFHQIAKYYYYPGWHEPGATLEIILNKRKFESLPQHLQQIIEAAAAKLNIWTLSEFEVKNAEYLEKIVQEGKVSVRPFPDEVLQYLRGISETVIEDICKQDPLSRKVHDSLVAFKRKMKPWVEMTEKRYIDALM